MAQILIIYSSTDGHTLNICHRLQQILEPAHHVTLVSLEEAAPNNLRACDKIIIGASIRYGKHSEQLIHFINRNVLALSRKPGALFSVNLVARKPGKNQPETNPYMRRLLKQIAWRPRELAVFAGKIDYPSYGFFDRLIIRLIMWITRGPTDPKAVVEYTDWQQVEAFGRLIGEL